MIMTKPKHKLVLTLEVLDSIILQMSKLVIKVK